MRTFTPVKLIKYKMGWHFLGVTPKKLRSPTLQIQTKDKGTIKGIVKEAKIKSKIR